MSKEAVMELLAKADKDEALRQELDSIAERSGDHAAELMAVAEKHGCTFTAEEFGEALQALPGDKGELSDDQLEGVAGGVIGDPGRFVLQPRTIGTFTRLRNVVSPIGMDPNPVFSRIGMDPDPFS